MPIYIALVNWTDQGIRNIKESPKRLDAARSAFRALGAEVKAFYMVTGRYDMVAIIEARDDEALAKALLSLGSAGNVRTETLRAYTEEEYRKIIAALP